MRGLLHPRSSSTLVYRRLNALASPRNNGWNEYGGPCYQCEAHHALQVTPLALSAAEEVAQRLTETGRIDYDVDPRDAHPALDISEVWTKGPGRMFGVLTLRRREHDHDVVVLKAFSGQMANFWVIPGWVGPVAQLTHESSVYQSYRTEIEGLSKEIHRLEPTDERVPLLKSSRKRLSHELLFAIQSSYTVRGRENQAQGLVEVYNNSCAYVGCREKRRRAVASFPAGTGDCCAPKLIHAATRLVRENGYEMEGMVEFWYGKNKGNTNHLNVYGPCEKCRLILGPLLCGFL